MNRKYVSVIIFSIFLAFGSTTHTEERSITLDTPYGIFTVTQPVLCDLLECSSVKRLQGINQYGIDAFVNNFPEYTRYQHSVGVMCILRRFGASLQEQIAGLLHDVSHTVFSHVGDHLFGVTQEENSMRDTKDSYQDGIHTWFIKNTEIVDVLESHGYTVDDIVHKNGTFLMLEQDAPDLCADRIEYNLYGGLIENRITYHDINFILEALRYNDGHWYFVDAVAARKIADVSLFLTEHHFGTGWNGILNKWAAQVLQRALALSLLSLDDIHFSTDIKVWQILCATDDQIISLLIEKLYDYKKYYREVGKDAPYDYSIYPKFRGLNPLVMNRDGTLVRLCNYDLEYAREFERVKNTLRDGRFVQWRQP